MKVVVTGGSGFIASYVVRGLVEKGHQVIVVDRGSYASKVKGLRSVLPYIKFLTGDLREPTICQRIVDEEPNAIIHMAAETHVDRSIDHPMDFVTSNIHGTVQLLQAIAMNTWKSGRPTTIVYSTDEVFGPTPRGQQFKEDQAFNPSNAYSASKVAIEAYCRSFEVTHNLPIIIVRPSNTYGPGQFPEKIIPLFIQRMMKGEKVPLFGKGEDCRDWLYGTDHAEMIYTILEKGRPGESFNMAREDEHTNLEVTTYIHSYLAMHGLIEPGRSLESFIQFTEPRPGHDSRYWMDGSKVRLLGWRPKVSFQEGMKKTVTWYVNNPAYHDSDLYSYPISN